MRAAQLLDGVWARAKGHVSELRRAAPSQLRYLTYFAHAALVRDGLAG
jgi:hypothetical protein